MPLDRDSTTSESVSKKNNSVDYYEYINSDQWRIRARMIRKAAGNRCQLCNCNDKSLHVHHRSYERLGDEHPGDLTVLCEDCHAQFHRKESSISKEHFDEFVELARKLAETHSYYRTIVNIFGEPRLTANGTDDRDTYYQFERNKLLGSALAFSPNCHMSKAAKKARVRALKRIITMIRNKPQAEIDARIAELHNEIDLWEGAK